jgi:DNA-binding NarL/FixJ family response regulator
MAKQHITSKSATVLRLIAEGHSYNQIVELYADLTYLDIFRAAEEALELLVPPAPKDDHLAAVRQKHPRAYEPWLEDEESSLVRLYKEGLSTATIADRLQRQPSAIESRLRRLGLAATADPKV